MTSKAGIMSNIGHDDLIQLWNKILQYQTIFFGPEEVNILREWGFGDTKKGILDAGCGNGDYGLFLANHFPDTGFFGIDANENFISEFSKKNNDSLSQNYSIYQCDMATDPFPNELKGKFDQCLLRLVLQHVVKPISILEYINEELPHGGQVFVVEEDDGFFKIYPDCPAFYRVVEIWKEVCDYAGSVRYIGSEIPELMTKSGFNVKRAKVVLHSNFEVGTKLIEYLVATVKMLHLTNPKLVKENEAERIAKEFDRYLDKNRDSWFAVYPLPHLFPKYHLKFLVYVCFDQILADRIC